LSEVVADRWIPIAGDELAVVNGTARPDSHDVASHVALRVNGNGEAEFTIVGSTSSRTEVIPWPKSR
jgi:hypothetical protein